MAKELAGLQERLHVPVEERRQQHRELDQELEFIQNYVELHDSSASAEALQRQKEDIDRCCLCCTRLWPIQVVNQVIQNLI